MPSAAKIVVYSQPITPAPITAMLRGRLRISRISSLSCTRGSSNGTSLGRVGTEPVATRMTSPVSRRSGSFSRVTRTVCGSSKAAWP